MAFLVTIPNSCLLVAFLALLPLTPCQAPDSHPADPSASEIAAVLTSQQTAWNRGDIGAFMDGYWNSPDLTFLGSSGISRGWQAVFTRYRQRYPTEATMGHLDFSDLEIRLLSATSALAFGRWHLSLRSAAGDAGGVFTLVFQKFPAGWKIVHDHTSQLLSKQP